MSDALRAIPMHQAGATNPPKRSVPVDLLLKAEPVTGFILVPKPPASGAFTLKSTDGVLSWEAAA